MEAITSMASAAAKAVWGDNNDNPWPDINTMTGNSGALGQEPISGKQGDTSKGEPFDAGNMDGPTQQRLSDNNQTYDDHVAKRPASIRTPAAPTADPRKKIDESAEGLDSSEHAAKKKKEGVGSSAIAEVEAEEHGGGAAASSKDVSSGGDVHADAAAKVDDVSGLKNKDEEGIGEKYVKSTGLAADGGNFDVTKPGAGREADRLLEVKRRVSHIAASGGGGSGGGYTTELESSEPKGKPSLKEKIKAKLHKH